MLQPIFSVIFDDDGPLSVLARPQPSRSNFLVRLCSSDIVILAELSDAHGSLSGTPSSFCFRNFRFHGGDLAVVGRDGSGDRARVCAGDGEMNRDNTDRRKFVMRGNRTLFSRRFSRRKARSDVESVRLDRLTDCLVARRALLRVQIVRKISTFLHQFI